MCVFALLRSLSSDPRCAHFCKAEYVSSSMSGFISMPKLGGPVAEGGWPGDTALRRIFDNLICPEIYLWSGGETASFFLAH